MSSSKVFFCFQNSDLGKTVDSAFAKTSCDGRKRVVKIFSLSVGGNRGSKIDLFGLVAVETPWKSLDCCVLNEC